MNQANGANLAAAGSCPDHYGTLPSCANLALAYVPFQQENAQKYNQTEALSAGTLYPGLNLPFRLKVEGGTLPNTPMTDLQAMDFVLMELGHYLDTHPDDKEATEMFRQYSAMYKTARAAYEAKNGPLSRLDAVQNGKYSWLKSPWPWEYEQNEVR